MIDRKDQRVEDTWDLSALTNGQDEWERDCDRLKKKLEEAESYRGTMSLSDDNLFKALEYLEAVSKELERLDAWASLSYTVDGTNPTVMRNMGICQDLIARYSQALAFFDPELMEIKKENLDSWLKQERFAPYKVYVEKSIRYKDHILSQKEEELLALFSPISDSSQEAFQDLDNIDLDFGYVNGEKLTHSNYSRFLQSEDDGIREEAYRSFYKAYDSHQHVISRLYEASIKKDIFLSKARGYNSSLEQALFPENMPKEVYTSLIKSVHDAFPSLHRYYAIRAKLMGKEKLKHWDVYTPLIKEEKTKTTYDEAVNLISEAVMPLGKKYRDTLVSGLTKERWVDRYENRGKRSGAFSSGGYIGNPYILTNYEDEVLRSVFTLIHEAGHSMHSYYSAKNNPFMSYSYTIFEAEVASTFNENLLFRYMLDHAESKKQKASLIAMKLDDIVATLFRQTMFAEFELICHEEAEKGTPITVDFFRSEYRKLLEEYFGPSMELEDVSDLEGLRIPHFYRAFYCYKYATGISASIALSEKVLSGGEKEKEAYLAFLKSGGSKYPLQSLKLAGVDMSTPEPVSKAAEYFTHLLNQLEDLLA